MIAGTADGAAAESPGSLDAELVGRTRAGDRQAYADLVRRHQQPLFRHVRGMGLEYDTALDLVQDAFVRAYTRIGECREPSHFRAWLFTIARRLCFDYLKDVRRRTIPLSAVPDAERIPAETEDRDGSGRALREALEALPPLLREAFLLKHDAGYTYEEMAIIGDASPSAVKMRVHRARELLRAALHRSGVGPADVTIRRSPVVSVDEHDQAPVRAYGFRSGGVDSARSET
jgi:RNA polymerase sigma-70 factor, ECF subfamily